MMYPNSTQETLQPGVDQAAVLMGPVFLIIVVIALGLSLISLPIRAIAEMQEEDDDEDGPQNERPPFGVVDAASLMDTHRRSGERRLR